MLWLIILKISHQLRGKRPYPGKAVGVANSDLLVRICTGKTKKRQEPWAGQDCVYFCTNSVTDLNAVIFNDYLQHQPTGFDF